MKCGCYSTTATWPAASTISAPCILYMKRFDEAELRPETQPGDLERSPRREPDPACPEPQQPWGRCISSPAASKTRPGCSNAVSSCRMPGRSAIPVTWPMPCSLLEQRLPRAGPVLPTLSRSFVKRCLKTQEESLGNFRPELVAVLNGLGKVYLLFASLTRMPRRATSVPSRSLRLG